MDDATKIKIEVILEDWKQRREEISFLVKFLYAFIPLLVTASGSAFAYVFSKKSVFPILIIHRTFVLGLFNQFFYLLGLAATQIFININTTSRYIKSIERKLNALTGEHLCVGELSRLLECHSVYPYVCGLLVLLITVGFVTSAFYVNILLGHVSVAESLFVAGALLYDSLYSDEKQQAWLAGYGSGKDA